MKLGVKILPRAEVLDAQGRAVEHTLKAQGFDISSCRVGRYVQVEVEGSNEAQARQKVKDMAEYVLFNPLIESFEIEVLEK